MRRIYAIIFSFLVMITPLLSANADSGVVPYDVDSLVEEYAILVDAAEPTTSLFGTEKNADERCFPASTTKLLTCIVALENGKLDDVIEVSENAVALSRANSKMGLIAGEKYSLEDMLYGLMLPSGNDAAIAIAEHFAGSVESFSKIMNTKARELGMNSSNFVNPNGLHDDKHYTTARDMAVLTAYAMENEQLRLISSTPTREVKPLKSDRNAYVIKNTNRLLVDSVRDDFVPKSYLYEYCIGGKTGSTNAAGRCLIAVAEKDGLRLIAVLLGDYESFTDMSAEDADALKSQRFTEAADLFEYGFENCFVEITPYKLKKSGLTCDFEMIVETCKTDSSYSSTFIASVVANEEDSFVCMWYESADILTNPNDYVTVVFDEVSVPIEKGQVLGRLDFSFKGNVAFSLDIVADSSVAEVVISPAPSISIIMIESTALPTPIPVDTEALPEDNPGSMVILAAVSAIALVAIIIIMIIIVRKPNRPKRK